MRSQKLGGKKVAVIALGNPQGEFSANVLWQPGDQVGRRSVHAVLRAADLGDRDLDR